MPASAAVALTASSNGFGRRMLARPLFGWNSKRNNLISERSYSVRSDLAMKSSASLSLFSFGNFFFISPDLLRMHITRTDRANQKLAGALAQRTPTAHNDSSHRVRSP